MPTQPSLTIAHVLPSFGLGGQERVALRLAIEQRALGHRTLAVSLAPPPDGPLAAQFAEAGVEVRTVPKIGQGFDLALPARLSALFADERVSVVHAHNPQPLIYAAVAGKGAGASVVYTCHGESSNTPARLWLTRVAMLVADAYVAVSPRIATRAREHGECAAGKIRVIDNGVDLSSFARDATARADVRRELGVPQDAWVIGTVGRLVPDKNPELLLRAAAPLLGPNVRLMFVGDGPEANGLRQLAATLPNGKYVLLPGVRRDVPRLLSACDVFALSSRTEGLPLALIEAMAAGLPVVSTAVGGVPDVVKEGRTGLLVPSHDEAALRAALAAVHSLGVRATDMGAAGRTASQSYSAAAMTSNYLQLYRACRDRTSELASLP